MKLSPGSWCSYTSHCLPSSPFSMQAPCWAATAAICRRRDQWMDSGGGNKCPRFISPGSTLSCAKPTQPTQPNSGRMRDPKVHGFWLRPDPGHMDGPSSLQEEVVRRIQILPPSTKVFIPNGNSVKWAKRTRQLITAIVCQLAAIPACQLTELFSDSSAFL